MSYERHVAFLEIDYPTIWTAHRLGPADAVFDAALNAVAHLASPTPRGTSSIILAGRSSVEFAIPAGTGGQASTLPSPPAYLLSALMFGADTLAMTFGKVPGAPAADPTKTAKAIGLAFAAKGCLSTLDSLVHHDITDAASVGELFRTATDMATGCLADQWELAYGLTGFLGQFAVGTVLWLVEGIKLAIDGVHAAIDNVLYWGNYRVNIGMPVLAGPTPAAQLPVFAGTPGNAAALESRLRTGVAGLPIERRPTVTGVGCQLYEVFGANLGAGAMDVYIGVPGGSCGGDAAGTYYRIRDWRVVASADICGDCGPASADYARLTAPYAGRPPAQYGTFAVQAGGPAGWHLAPLKP